MGCLCKLRSDTGRCPVPVKLAVAEDDDLQGIAGRIDQTGVRRVGIREAERGILRGGGGGCRGFYCSLRVCWRGWSSRGYRDEHRPGGKESRENGGWNFVCEKLCVECFHVGFRVL